MQWNLETNFKCTLLAVGKIDGQDFRAGIQDKFKAEVTDNVNIRRNYSRNRKNSKSTSLWANDWSNGGEKVSDSHSWVVCFCCLACPFTSEGVINPPAFPPLMTKCWLDSVSPLWPCSKALQPAIHHQILIWFHRRASADIWFMALGAILEFLTVNKGSLGNVNVVLVWGPRWCKRGADANNGGSVTGS